VGDRFLGGRKEVVVKMLEGKVRKSKKKSMEGQSGPGGDRGAKAGGRQGKN